jgi:hypothetical protein
MFLTTVFLLTLNVVGNHPLLLKATNENQIIHGTPTPGYYFLCGKTAPFASEFKCEKMVVGV